jgi:hypothetical protein
MTTPTPNLDFRLDHDAWGRLVLTEASGKQSVGVEPIPSFPISDSERWISICDAQGRELLCVDDLAQLPEDVRRVLIEELARRSFIPRIKRIHRVSGHDPSQWDVETDRGAKSFLIRSDDDVRRLGPYRCMLVDAHGIRFLIPDTRQLDDSSRRTLERYL